MKQKQAKTFITVNSDSCTPATYSCFVENFASLHGLVQSINDNDGNRKQVSKFTVIIRAYSVARSVCFGIQPVVVQTAGTFSDTVAQNVNTIDTALAAAIDDVFGYDRVGNYKVSKAIPTGDGTLATLQHNIEMTIPLPAKLLGILNKEVESERLQELYFGVVGFDNTTGIAINFQLQYVIDFVEQRQAIVIR
jgi:hypothetical protein